MGKLRIAVNNTAVVTREMGVASASRLPDMEYIMIDTKYITLAKKVSTSSEDPSTKVGCVIVKEIFHPAGSHEAVFTGYNDLTPGTPEYFWREPELKYPHVVHAEVYAMLSAGIENTTGAILYCTAHPCRDCARLIAAAHIKVVVCPGRPWRDDPAIHETINHAKEIFKRAGIIVQYIEAENV